MSANRKHLGRGLEALLGANAAAANVSGSADSQSASQPSSHPSGQSSSSGEAGLRELPIDQLQRGEYQPRVDMHSESLNELANSIRVQGIVQPILVRPIEASVSKAGAGYEIIAGERRWRAAQLAGLHHVPVVIRELSDVATMAVSLIENIQREDLNPIEEANALKRLIGEFELTHQEAADAVGRSRVAVTNLLRLLELPKTIQDALTGGKISMGHARAVLGLRSLDQTRVIQQAINRSLSVRETENLVRRFRRDADEPKSKKSSGAKTNSDIQRLEQSLGEKLGAKVQIRHRQKGSGELVVAYNNLEELDGILEHIK